MSVSPVSYARLESLVQQERRAADILLAHLDELATYRASELAALAGVSKATMSRLFRTLGFDDFMQVRRHLRDLRDQDAAEDCWTTSNSSSADPEATGRARSPEWAVIAGPCNHAWNDSSVSQWVTTK